MKHILLFSRIAVVDVSAFVALVEGAAGLKGVRDADIWNLIMTQWWYKVSLMFTGLHIIHHSPLANVSFIPSSKPYQNHKTRN